MKPHGCRYLLLPSKKIHISYALPYGHEKREMIFYSSKHISSHQVATNVRKIWDLGSNFSNETKDLLAISKNPHLIRSPIRSQKKRNRFFIVVNTLVATKWLLMLGKFETKVRILAMRLAFARLLASFATIKKIHFSPSTRKKGQALLDLPITFLEITF